jgi:site-specific recombinase XerD
LKNYESVSKQRKLPAILSWEEQESLLNQPNPKAPTGLRNLCIMKLMLDAGLRLSEVINLRPADVNFESGSLNIQEIGLKSNAYCGLEKIPWSCLSGG